MFQLPNKTFPSDVEGLRLALEQGLRRVLTAPGPMVTVEDKSYPRLAALRISLDGATTGDEPPPRPARPVELTERELEVANFEISGRPLFIGQARVELACLAREIRLAQARDGDGNALLILQDAAAGRIEFAIAKADLEALALTAVKAAALRQGVQVEDVRIDLRARSERVLDIVAHIQAKKLFLGATLRISGRAEIDERLTARLSGLECTGDGPLGTLACGLISPHLQRLSGREFSLMAVPIGEARLNQVRLATVDGLRITAEFGHPA
jgi:hypothetical protein